MSTLSHEGEGISRSPGLTTIAMSKQSPDIDLSLVTYNSQRWLPDFFRSLAAQDFPLSKIHLSIVDHSPDEDCVEALHREVEGLPLASVEIERRENLGFGAGHNRAVALGQSEFVLVSNVDLTFEADTLARLVGEAIADEPNVAAWECRQKPFEHPKNYDILTHNTPWVSGACLLLRRSAFEQIGGFDERFFMYGEDVDLSLRLREQGYHLRYCPDCVVWHHAYEQPGQIKAGQYFGATLANMYLRLRFGTARDIAIGLAMQAALLVHPSPVAGRLRGVLRNYGKLIQNAWYFIESRSHKNPRPHRGRGHGEGATKGSAFTLTRRVSRVDLSLNEGEGNLKAEFRKWDYALHREGAFVAAMALPADPPLVSIVVRTYPGRLPLLKQALASLQAQTWRNLEVVVVEDGGETCRNYVSELNSKPSPPGRGEGEGTDNSSPHPPGFTGRPLPEGEATVQFVYHAAPKFGRCRTGNIGLELATGVFIGFLDDDDLLFADHVETLATTLLAHGGMNAAYAHAWEVETAFTPGAWTLYHEQPPRGRMPRAFDAKALWCANYIPIQTVLFRRELYEKHGGFHEPLDALEDWDLWQRYALDGYFLYVDKTTSIYRTPANRDTRPERMLALARYYRLAAERQAGMIKDGKSIADRRHELGIGDPFYVSERGQRLMKWLARHPRIYQWARVIVHIYPRPHRGEGR
jgi:GT2 family glycosyltransferase